MVYVCIHGIHIIPSHDASCGVRFFEPFLALMFLPRFAAIRSGRPEAFGLQPCQAAVRCGTGKFGFEG